MMKRLFVFLGVILFGGLVFLFSAELLLRIFYFGPDAIVNFRRYEPLDTGSPYFLVLSEDARVGVELRPNHRWFFLGKERQTNALGLCDKPRSEEELKDATMVVMGESFAEGAGVRLEERFSAQLEKELRNKGRFNVVNMAITNTVLESQIELFKTKVLPVYHPKWVLVAFLADGNMNAPVLGRDVWSKRIAAATKLFPLWKRSFALFIVNDYWGHINWDIGWFAKKLIKWARGASEENVFSVQPRSQQAVTDQSRNGSRSSADESLSGDYGGFLKAKGLLEELKQLGQEQDFQVILCPLSHIKAFNNPDRNHRERRILGKIARDIDVPYLDVFSFFDGKDPRYCILWASNRHPNKYCHRLIAEKLAETLLESIC